MGQTASSISRSNKIGGFEKTGISACPLSKQLLHFACPKPASKLSGVLWRWGRKRKESLQLHVWNLNICIKKVDTKC